MTTSHVLSWDLCLCCCFSDWKERGEGEEEEERRVVGLSVHTPYFPLPIQIWGVGRGGVVQSNGWTDEGLIWCWKHWPRSPSWMDWFSPLHPTFPNFPKENCVSSCRCGRVHALGAGGICGSVPGISGWKDLGSPNQERPLPETLTTGHVDNTRLNGSKAWLSMRVLCTFLYSWMQRYFPGKKNCLVLSCDLNGMSQSVEGSF